MVPAPNYYRYKADVPDGVYDTPHFGEVYPGRIVEVRPDQLSVVNDNSAWERATRKQYEDQPPVAHYRAGLVKPPAD